MFFPLKFTALRGWEKELWQVCWIADIKLLDFTNEAWVKLTHERQFEYAKAYQEWYAEKNGYPVDKEIEKEFEGKKVKFIMVLIPPGKFWMGSPDTEKERISDEKCHKVVISKPYRIGKYEVTQAQWKAVMGDNPSYFKDSGDNAPVENVSWYICNEGENGKDGFCNRTGFKLPTETQWEYACRGGTTGPFNLWDNISPDQVNYNGDYPYAGGSKGVYRGKTVEVGSLKFPNSWGCHDFHGNVWEWCEDLYGSYELKEETVDPTGPSTGSRRVIRGGGWYGSARFCRSACRNRYWLPGYRDCGVGLRVLSLNP